MQRWDKILGKPVVRIRSGLCHCLSNLTASHFGIYGLPRGALWYYRNVPVWCCLCCICPSVRYSTKPSLISQGCAMLGLTCTVNEPVGKLLKQKEVITTPCKEVISVGTLDTCPIKAQKDFLEIWCWDGGTWNNAFMAAGTSVEGSGSLWISLQVLQKRGRKNCATSACDYVCELSSTTLKRIS